MTAIIFILLFFFFREGAKSQRFVIDSPNIPFSHKTNLHKLIDKIREFVAKYKIIIPQNSRP